MRVSQQEVKIKSKTGRSLRPQDWTPADQAAWFDASASEKIFFVKNIPFRVTKKSLRPEDLFFKELEDQVHNSFVNAALYNLRQRQGDREYKNIKQRHILYDVVAYLIQSNKNVSQLIHQVKFFAAAAKTTGVKGVMEAETLDARVFLLNEETLTVITHINKILLSRNLPIMGNLLFVWKEPQSPVSGKKVTPFIFDIHMVFFEQSHVQDYLKLNKKLITAKVKEDFGENLMDVESFEVGMSSMETSMKWALKALKKPKIFGFGKSGETEPLIENTVLDFLVYKDRIFIGIAAVHRFHGKKYDEFESFVKKLGNVKPIVRGIQSL